MIQLLFFAQIATGGLKFDNAWRRQGRRWWWRVLDLQDLHFQFSVRIYWGCIDYYYTPQVRIFHWLDIVWPATTAKSSNLIGQKNNMPSQSLQDQDIKAGPASDPCLPPYLFVLVIPGVDRLGVR